MKAWQKRCIPSKFWLHLWRPKTVEIPTPPAILVGPLVEERA
jgi:hypothetical protein